MRLVDLGLDRLESDDAVLNDRRRNPSDHMHAIGLQPRQIKAGLEPRQRHNIGEPGDCLARGVVGDDIDMPAGLRDFLDDDGHAPSRL